MGAATEPRLFFPTTMPAEITIREERADQPEVVALLDMLDRYLGSLYAPEANHIMDVASLLAPEVTFLVARDGDQVVGTGACRRMQGEPETDRLPYGEIKRMVVDPARRGERIGARLLQALEDRLRAEGTTLALLETGREQTEAVKLYERSGYTERGPFCGYPDNGLSVFYGKRL
jgi:putative acetyltransferase